MDQKKCGGKNCYRSEKEARRMKGVIGRGRGKDVRIYQCETCHHWHLTKKTKHA